MSVIRSSDKAICQINVLEMSKALVGKISVVKSGN